MPRVYLESVRNVHRWPWHGYIRRVLAPLGSTGEALVSTLANGLTLILVPSQVAPVVAMQAWVGVGAADEVESEAGISHVLEHMLFKGTPTRAVGEIARDVESAGGDINAWTSHDDTVFHVVVPSRFATLGIEVLADVVIRSSLDEGELSREREVILEEIRQSNDDPMRSLSYGLFALAYPGHPYARPVIGRAETVSSFRRSHLVRFRHKFYRGGNIRVIVAGDFEVTDMRRRLAKSFAEVPKGPSNARTVPAFPARHRARSIVTPRDVHQASGALAIRLPQVRHEDCVAMDLLAVALGQGESSILARDLVLERELCLGAYSYLHPLRQASLFVVGVSSIPERFGKSLTEVGKHLRRIVREPISPEAFEKARHAIEADAVYQLETAEGMARKYGFYASLTSDPNFEREYLRRLAALSPARIQSVAEGYLSRLPSISAVVPSARSRSTAGKRGRNREDLLSFVERGMRATAARPKARSHHPTIVSESLDNGLRVVVLRDPAVPIVAARAVWRGGLLVETARNVGITQVLAETITKGCGSKSAAEIAEEVDQMASSLSGFGGRNSFGVRAEWLARDWMRGFDLFADCLSEPTFPMDEIERHKRRQLQQLESQRTNPSWVAFRLLLESLYRAHPYRMNILGTAKAVSGTTRSQLQRHYQAHYPISAMTLAVVGDIEPDLVLQRARARFDHVEKREAVAHAPVADPFHPRRAAPRQVFAHLEREQAQLVIGFPGVTLFDDDRFALEVLVTILGAQSGRLFVALRERKALAYRVGAYSLEGLDPGYVAVYLACAPEKVGEAIEGIRFELDHLTAVPPSTAELARVRRYLVGTHEISLQRRSSVASALAFHEAYGTGYAEYQRYARAIQKVRAADVMRVAGKILQWPRAVIATVHPAPPSSTPARRRSGPSKRGTT